MTLLDGAMSLTPVRRTTAKRSLPLLLALPSFTFWAALWFHLSLDTSLACFIKYAGYNTYAPVAACGAEMDLDPEDGVQGLSQVNEAAAATIPCRIFPPFPLI